MIELNKLESHLWEAANILRGPVDAADFKTYIFPLLFFKRLCDVYDEEIAAALQESDGSMTYALFAEQHRFQVPGHCHWKEVRDRSANIGHALQEAMRDIEKANPDTLLGIFGDAQWTNKDRLSDALLKDLIEHFSKLNLGNDNCRADVLGQAYEYLIKKFADLTNKKAGEFYTPRSVVDLLVRILDPEPGETIYDPACGTGGMLLGALHFVKERGGDPKLMLGKLHGQEKNLTTSAIARMNLFLHGMEDFEIERGDTLRQPRFHSGDGLAVYDCVIANPPFSLEKWGEDVWVNDPYGRNFAGLPPTKSGDFAWVQHMIKSMAPKTGRMTVVLPHGVLFRAAKEGGIRRNLLEADNLEAVIGLGPNLFYGAGLAACILVFRETKPRDHRQKVLFIDASREFKTGRAQNELLPEHVERIHHLYEEYRDVEGICRVVSLDGIRENDFNLNIPRYVEPVIEEETITVEDAVANLKNSLDTAYVAEDHLTRLLERADIGQPGIPDNGGDYEQGDTETSLLPVAAEASPLYGEETTHKTEHRRPSRPRTNGDQNAERAEVLPIRDTPKQTTEPSVGITQAELESYLWGAATLLRGTIDAGDYKQFIFTLLFFKRLCDVYDEERAEALDESGGDEGYAELPEQHRFQIPPDPP